MSNIDQIASLTIVLVNYNSGEWLERCLKSFQNIKNWSTLQKKWRVVMVDNDSTDGSTEVVEKAYPWLEIIRLPENRGFAAGNNVALADVDTEFAMLLNTDTEFLVPTDLNEFILRNFAQAEVGVLSPRVELTDGSLDHACHRGFPTIWNAAMYFSGITKRFPTVKWLSGYTLGWQDSKKAHASQACTGAAMIVRTSAMKQVGLLDEAFFMYAEDIDWCLRFVQAGWTVWYDPSVVVTHHKHKSGKGKHANIDVKLRTTAAFYDTMKLYFRKHHGKTPALVLLVTFAMIDILKYRKLTQERTRHVQ